jgi:hypothetical protein
MRLYDIHACIREVFDNLGDEEEIPDGLFETIRDLQAEGDEKLDAIAALVKENKAEAEAMAEEIKWLRQRQQVREKRAERLKQYLMDCLSLLGERKHDTGRFVVRIQANPPSLNCKVEPDAVNPAFQRHRVEVDKEKAMLYYKQTGEVPLDFELVQGQHLRIG